jgi:CRP-like cAMP-binding protein
MAQLKRGGKLILDYLYSDLAFIDEHAADDPAAVRRLTQVIRDRIREDIEPLLMRAEPTIEARLKALEDWRDSLEQPNVTRFRKAE